LDLTAERALKATADLSDEEARKRPQGLASIVWQLGHIAFYDGRATARAGGDVVVPAEYEALFKIGTGDAANFPPLAEVRKVFEAQHRKLVEATNRANLDDAPKAPHPTAKTIGESSAYTIGHRGYHTGKIATLRALIGKSRVFG
jgi:uncharacterized damage-inducible protein DinB